MSRVIDLLATEAGDEVWLASGIPRYWLEPGKIVQLYHASTIYGEVSYELKSGTKPNTIEASINLPKDMPEEKAKLFVRSPFEKQIQSVLINGKLWNNWNARGEYITLPSTNGKLNVLIKY